MALRMPRGDVFRALHPAVDPFETSAMASDPASPDDPFFRCFRSGFWGMARILERAHDADCVVLLRGRLEGGEVVSAELGRIATTGPTAEAVELPEPVPEDGPLVAICMATYEPSPSLLQRQLESIRAQTHRNWVCVISDDCSSLERFAAIEEAVEGDPRFVVSRSPRAAALLPQLRARAGACARRRGPRRDVGPGRLLASGQARVAAGGNRGRAARLQRRPARHPGRPADRRDVLEPTQAQPPQPALAARRQLGHGSGLPLSPRAARPRASVPASSVHAFSRPLDRADGCIAGGDCVRGPPALRLRAARECGPRTRGRQSHADVPGPARQAS